MSVYVDDAREPYGRMLMCHMLADSTDELLAMADRIGVQRRWIQHPGSWREHFDIALSKRALAVQAGAVEVTTKWLAGFRAARRHGTTGTPCIVCGLPAAHISGDDAFCAGCYAITAPPAPAPRRERHPHGTGALDTTDTLARRLDGGETTPTED